MLLAMLDQTFGKLRSIANLIAFDPDATGRNTRIASERRFQFQTVIPGQNLLDRSVRLLGFGLAGLFKLGICFQKVETSLRLWGGMECP